ncbi:hypothetical protein [Flammeovirga kamogawensis]|uniref:Transporter n=1 Tax=Flammeovirga kamogawensis TaxID=373891 RepID=A0ABX8GWA2_9BACT|nr:hypothetical protein [Flammeovirga kamogawensis]MBB6461113.1 hypothetical protein [Flammeovirga kamogawensis]QWG07679.1 hypothetical protein KM029_01715 [Flammeovirga kamogawensis]TRX69489.1 hypothetical protein EO216_15655 [Flammeovirga kamogawensis]
MTVKKLLILLFLITSSNSFIHAQGCSDAGICTTGALNPDSDRLKFNKVDNKFTLSYQTYWQNYKEKAFDYGIGFSVDYKINSRSSLQLKSLYAFREGPLTTTQGISDITLSYSYLVKQWDNWNLSAVFGTKIPTSDASSTFEGKPIPMFYEPSLGTYDGLFGIALNSKAWHLSFGIQQPLTTLENHEYDPEYYKNEPNYELMKKWYTSSRHLDRKYDVSGRIKYTLRTSKWSFAPSVLAIYKHDRTYIESLENGDYLLEGSQGLVINSILEGSYNFSPHLSLSAIAAYAAKQRAFNPDGLARDYVVNLIIKHQF